MNALCGYIFDVSNSEHAEFTFYDMCATSGENCSKAATLSKKKPDETLAKDGIDWNNVITVATHFLKLNSRSFPGFSGHR